MTDSEGNAVEVFAQWLRQMRLLGGDLSLRELERRTARGGGRVARSTLQDALDAKRLPSIDHAVAMVRAMTGDEAVVQECRNRWRLARSAITGVAMPELPPAPTARPASAYVPAAHQGAPVRVPEPTADRGQPVWWRRKTAAAAAAAVVVLAVTGGAYAVRTTDTPGSPRPSASADAAGPAAATLAGSEQPGSAATPASSTLPPYLHIQAQDVGCHGNNFYDETPAQYKQHQQRGRAGVGPGVIDITNQTSSGEAVLLTGMHVLTRQRNPLPTSGIVVGDGSCGGTQEVRPFSVNLDRPNSPIIAERDLGGPGAPGHPPVAFPFKISPGDPEVFELTANTATCDCTIAVEVDWVAAGKAGKTILDNAGRGFRVLGTPKAPAYLLGGPALDQLIPATSRG